MQLTTTLSVGLLAALATASPHVPQHFHQRRQYNVSVPSTTLTVFATEVYTITSCAATVTDCPARSSGSSVGQVVTATVKAYTTVCPVAEAASASSAILSSYSAHDSSTAKGPVSTPMSTGVSANAVPYPTGEVSKTTPSGPVGTGFTTKGAVVYPTASGSESVVLTYTLGSGTSTTVVTTTIKHTQTATVYATKPAESGSQNGGVPSSPSAAAASSESLTTTITGTSTSTHFVTVYPVSSATGTLGAAGSSACVPVTVTVTQATATVTVTAPAYSTGANSGAASSAPSAQEVYPTGGAPEVTPNSQLVPVSTATVVPVPYSTGAPYSNGTVSAGTNTKTKCSSIFPSGHVSSVTAAAVPTGSYPASVLSSSGKPSGVALPTGGYSAAPAPSSSVTAAGGPSSSAPAGYPVASAPASSSSTAAGVPVPSSSAPAGYPAAYPTY